MLILTRKVEQGILINGNTTVRVLSIEGERVKLGIEAPKAVAVLREELVQEVAGANREAATRGGDPALLGKVPMLRRGTRLPPKGQAAGGPPPAS